MCLCVLVCVRKGRTCGKGWLWRGVVGCVRKGMGVCACSLQCVRVAGCVYVRVSLQVCSVRVHCYHQAAGYR